MEEKCEHEFAQKQINGDVVYYECENVDCKQKFLFREWDGKEVNVNAG